MRNQFPQLYQIFEKSNQSNPEKNFLSYLFGDDPPTEGLSFYEYWESLFQKIDKENWEIFKVKAGEKLAAIQQYGKVGIIGEPQKTKIPNQWPPFRCLDTFNEVHGYLFLREEIDCDSVKFLQESKKSEQKIPDLEGWKDQTHYALDVKTINTSDDQAADYQNVASPSTGEIEYRSTSDKLESLLSKISSDISVAKKQLNSFHHAKKLIFFMINLDNDCNTSHFRNQVSGAMKQNTAMTNKDVTICGNFILDRNLSKGMEKFNWSS